MSTIVKAKTSRRTNIVHSEKTSTISERFRKIRNMTRRTMEIEIFESYHFRPGEFVDGKKADGTTFRDVVKEFERDFHRLHSGDYAEKLYANSATMHLLELGNGAAPFLSYGMELTKGTVFEPEADSNINHEIDKRCKNVMVYGIDSAFMDQFDEDGDPIFGEVNGIHPLTLLIDDTMSDGTVRLTAPGDEDDGEREPALMGHPKFQHA